MDIVLRAGAAYVFIIFLLRISVDGSSRRSRRPTWCCSW
jgi:hypothetical protein